MFDQSLKNYTVQDEEAERRKKIETAHRPIIIITEAGANSYGETSQSFEKYLPNVPIIFENDAAIKTFKKALWSHYYYMQDRVVGHFERASEFLPVGKKSFCDELSKSDCVMVFGTPKNELSKELQNHDDVMISETRNNQSKTTPIIPLYSIKASAARIENWGNWRSNIFRGGLCL